LHAGRRRLVARRHHVKPGQRIGIFAGREAIEGTGEPIFCGGKLRGEGLGDFGADFVTARADAGADGGDDVGGARAEFHSHFAENFLGDARECAAPAGVDGGDYAAARVGEEDGDAIGGLHGEKYAGRLRDERVGVGGARRSVRPGNYVNHIGMKLLRGDQGKGGGAQHSGKTCAARGDGGAGIGFGETEIEWRGGFDAGGVEARAKGVG